MMTIMPPSPAATCLAFFPGDNNIIAIGMDDSSILIYNVRFSEVFYPPLSHNIQCYFKKRFLGVFALPPSFMQVKSKLEGHHKRVSGLAFSNALDIMVSSGADGQVRWHTLRIPWNTVIIS